MVAAARGGAHTPTTPRRTEKLATRRRTDILDACPLARSRSTGGGSSAPAPRRGATMEGVGDGWTTDRDARTGGAGGRDRPRRRMHGGGRRPGGTGDRPLGGDRQPGRVQRERDRAQRRLLQLVGVDCRSRSTSTVSATTICGSTTTATSRSTGRSAPTRRSASTGHRARRSSPRSSPTSTPAPRARNTVKLRLGRDHLRGPPRLLRQLDRRRLLQPARRQAQLLPAAARRPLRPRRRATSTSSSTTARSPGRPATRAAASAASAATPPASASPTATAPTSTRSSSPARASTARLLDSNFTRGLIHTNIARHDPMDGRYVFPDPQRRARCPTGTSRWATPTSRARAPGDYEDGTDDEGVNQCHRSLDAYPHQLVNRGIVLQRARLRRLLGRADAAT